MNIKNSMLFFCVIPLQAYQLGIEKISKDDLLALTNKPLALLTNQTGKDQQGKRSIDVLLQKGFNIKKIFVPEHGFNGTIKAEKTIHNSRDTKTRLPIISLYAGNGPKKITPQDVEHIDAILVDLQDCGMRHFTYISTLYKVMEAAAQYNKKMMILDRPNPLGYQMEGPLVDPGLISFVSIAPIPLRHGLTIGEIARYFNAYVLKNPVELSIIPMEHYARTDGIIQWLSPLSYNIKRHANCLGYSFLGLLGEISPFDVGVGTDLAFQIICLPESFHFDQYKWLLLKTILAHNNIKSVLYSYHHKTKNKRYTGLRLAFPDINNISTMQALFDILDFFKRNAIEFNYQPLFNKAMGTSLFKDYYQNMTSRETLIDSINASIKEFYQRAKPLLLYEPLPVPTLLN